MGKSSWESLWIEPPQIAFTSRKVRWELERDRLGNVIAKAQGKNDLITDEELVNMPLDELATLLESGGW